MEDEGIKRRDHIEETSEEEGSEEQTAVGRTYTKNE